MRQAVTTTLSAVSAALCVFFARRAAPSVETVHYDLQVFANTLLAGLVGITGGCAVVEPWAAVVIGCTCRGGCGHGPPAHTLTHVCLCPGAWVGCVASLAGVSGALFVLTSNLMVKYRVDDPLDAVAVHGSPGLWGLVRCGVGCVYARALCTWRVMCSLQLCAVAASACLQPRVA